MAVGLGTTMTAQDILDGVMVVNVSMALTRRAEFVMLSLRQQLVKPE